MDDETYNNPGDGITSNSTPEHFQLDEIEWDETEYPVRSDSLPFKNTTKKILKELEYD